MIFDHENGLLPTKLAIILGVILVFLLGGGIVTYIAFQANNHNSTHQPKAQPPETREETNSTGPIFDLSTFIVNLLDDSGRRYLKISIKLALNNKLVQQEMIQKMPEIQDKIIVLLSSKSYDDVADTSGKIRLRAEIINRINKILTTGKICEVYFTDFVIQ